MEVCGSRIRVFLNNEKEPRIDVTDKNGNLAPSGQVTLGGGWIETEFDDLVVTPMREDALKDVKVVEYRKIITPQEKENKRQQERANYRTVKVNELVDSRTDVSLDGTWLFMPEYQLNDKDKAISVATDDKNWHVMSVPNFGILSVSGYMERQCLRPQDLNPKVSRILIISRKPSVVKDIHSIIEKLKQLGTDNG